MKKLLLLLFLAFVLPVIAQSTTFTWTASTSVGVSYNIYRGNAAGACTATAVPPACVRLNSAPLPVLIFRDTSQVPGSKYFYVVRAVDSNNIESVNSNEVEVDIPLPVAISPPSNLTAT